MNILVIGAHPDDGEVYAGGAILKWVQAGYRVLVVSATRGDVGHHEIAGEALAARRAEECAEAARRGGYEHRILPHHDGQLMPTLALREDIIRLIREHEADVVLTHRPYDYHPDHRYTSLTVQDAAYMVTVPQFLPAVPALRRNPVFLYMMDRFQKPTPFAADVALVVDDVMEAKWGLLDAMESQFYEWLAWQDGHLDAVPTQAEARRAWLPITWGPMLEEPARQGKDALARWYGDAHADARFVELFELCEYGSRPDAEEWRRIFPSLPQSPQTTA